MTRKLPKLELIALALLLCFSALSNDSIDNIGLLSGDTCNASFTYQVDTIDNLPVYTFSANNPNSNADYIWTLEGLERVTGPTLEHIFFDAGGWNVTLTAIAGEDTCNTSQNVDAIPPSTDECFFNYWMTDDLTIAVETWMPFPFYSDQSYTLDFGDGTTVENDPNFGVPLLHEYDTAGIYEICQIMNEDGCTYCRQVDLTIDPITCHAGFYYIVNSSSTNTYTFTAEEINQDIVYNWFINDVYQADSASFAYEFDSGEWVIGLKVFDGFDSCASSQTIHVFDEPDTTSCKAGFSYEQDSTNSNTYIFTPDVVNGNNDYLWYIDGDYQKQGLSFVYTFDTADYLVGDWLIENDGVWEVGLDVITDTDTCSSFQNIHISDTTHFDSLYIKGKLYADLLPIDGELVLYKKDNDTWYRHAEVKSLDGNFEFSQLSEGTYLIHARGDENLHSSYVPTYFVNGIGWRDAFTFDLKSSLEGVEITLIKFAALGMGSGQVTGKLVSESDEQVILLKERTSGTVLDWTLSSSDQRFSFDDLPFGNYSVTMEKPSGSITQYFSLSESQPNIEVELEASNVLGLEDIDEPYSVTIYPTLIENFFTIENTSASNQHLKLVLRTLSGKVVLSNELELGNGEVYIQDVPSSIANGMNLLQIVDNEGRQKLIRMIKK